MGGEVVPTYVFISSKPGLPWWLSGEESAFNAGDPGLIPGQEDSLKRGMATHSSILAWRVPWTEEFGRLQSMGSQKVTQMSD